MVAELSFQSGNMWFLYITDDTVVRSFMCSCWNGNVSQKQDIHDKLKTFRLSHMHRRQVMTKLDELAQSTHD